MSIRITSLAALAVVCTAACNKQDRGAAADTAAAMGARVDSGMRRDSATTAARADTAAATAKHNGWSDAQIVAYATAANNGEIAEGRLAESKATNPGVKAFARQLVADHEAMLRDGRAFATKHGITPDTTKDDVTDLMKKGRDEIKDLTDKARGADWDKDFLDKEIDGHKDVLGHLQDAAKNTRDTSFAQMLGKASGKVQEHLTKAQALKEKYPQS